MKLWKAGDWTKWAKAREVRPEVLELLRSEGREPEKVDELVAGFLSYLDVPPSTLTWEWDDEAYTLGIASWKSGNRSLELVFPTEPLGAPFQGVGISIDAKDGEATSTPPRTSWVCGHS